MEIRTFSDVTPDYIQDLKARHGDYLSQVTIKGENGKEANFIIKTPNRTVIDLVGQHSANKDVPATNKVLITNCVLAGDMDMMERDASIYSALLKAVNGLVKKVEVTLKTL